VFPAQFTSYVFLRLGGVARSATSNSDWLIALFSSVVIGQLGYLIELDSVFIKFFIYSYQEQGQVTPGEQVTLEKAQRTKKM